MLKKNNFDIIKDFEFPDHYDYSEKDLNKIISLSKANQSDIITTEKDYLRLPETFNDKIKSIKVKLKISNIAKLEKLLNEINL